jgi:hypothetical protein
MSRLIVESAVARGNHNTFVKRLSENKRNIPCDSPFLSLNTDAIY